MSVVASIWCILDYLVMIIDMDMYCFLLLYCICLWFRLWFNMVCIGNRSGLFMMLEGGLVRCVCCGSGVVVGFASVLGSSVWLFVINCVLRYKVRGCGCLLQGVGQSCKHFR